MGVDLVVVFSPVGGGHRAAAGAIAEAAARRGVSCEVVNAFDDAPRVFGEAYVAAHLTGQTAFPALYGSAYFAADRVDPHHPLEGLRHGVDRWLFAPLVRRIRALAPRVVVATHHLPLVALAPERRGAGGGATAGATAMPPLVGVVTDTTAHAVWAERGVDRFCVVGARAERDLVRHGVAPERIARTGIPVRAAFEACAPVVDPAPGEALRVLVTSGGFGVGPLGRIVRSLLRGAHADDADDADDDAGTRDVALTVVCGASEAAARHVAREIARASARAGSEAARRRLREVRVLGFERDMPARVAEAHVVVGKAGGLTVSETLAAGRPMIVCGVIPGNEAINAAYVASAGAGATCDARDVARTIAELRARGAIAAMGRRARAAVPHGTADAVLDVALGEARGRAAAA